MLNTPYLLDFAFHAALAGARSDFRSAEIFEAHARPADAARYRRYGEARLLEAIGLSSRVAG